MKILLRHLRFINLIKHSFLFYKACELFLFCLKMNKNSENNLFFFAFFAENHVKFQEISKQEIGQLFDVHKNLTLHRVLIT